MSVRILTGRQGVRHARAFCHRLIASFWKHFPHSSGVALRPLFDGTAPAELPEPAIALAEDIGVKIARLELLDAGYQLGLAYTALLPAEYRARHGVFYTPPALVDRLLDRATAAGVDWTRCRVLDPACGGGAFLAPVARRMLEALGECEATFAAQNITTRLAGFEIDPFSAWMSQVTLDAVILSAYPSARRLLQMNVRVCDSLEDHTPAPAFDLVIGNPPYGRVKLSNQQRRHYRRGVFGHANLYGLFTDLALRYTKPGGVVAYVTPTGFLAGEYFKNLRALLAEEAPPVSLDFVSARRGVFDGVLQETLLATYRRGKATAGAAVSVAHVSSPHQVRIEPTGVLRLPVDAAGPWIASRSKADAELIELLPRFTSRLADWGYCVSTGPLVWNRHKGQLRSRAGPGTFPLIWAESVTSDGRFEFRYEKRNHKPFVAPRPGGDEWLITREACVLLQRTTAKEQQRRLIAAALPRDFLRRHGAVVIENHLNMLRPIVDTPLVPPDVLAAFLNSAAADRVFRCVSGSVAVSAYELESLPLPSAQRVAKLMTLVEKGATRDAIERECAKMYAG